MSHNADLPTPLRRRDFLRSLGAAGAALLAGCALPSTGSASVSAALPTPTPRPLALNTPTPQPAAAGTKSKAAKARVALVKTDNRAEGVRRATALFGLPAVTGKSVFLKPNYNSADPAPGSTHLDVLETLVELLQAGKPSRIVLGERSGMGNTRQVLDQMGVLDLAQQMKFETLVFDELGAGDWQHVNPPGSHWARGFALPKALLAADVVVQACCLKTHRFGGHFTLSLKNSVGLAAHTVPGEGYNYMGELHASPHQRRMIAEINTAYTPSLIVLDGVEAFRSGGPDTGDKVQANVVLAGSDRVAVDAVGVALLRLLGTTPAVSAGSIFAQEQLARAVELGLGVRSGEEIELVTDDSASAQVAAQVKELLA